MKKIEKVDIFYKDIDKTEMQSISINLMGMNIDSDAEARAVAIASAQFKVFLPESAIRDVKIYKTDEMREIVSADVIWWTNDFKIEKNITTVEFKGLKIYSIEQAQQIAADVCMRMEHIHKHRIYKILINY